MRIEGDRYHAAVSGERLGLGDHGLVSTVHTIEDTDDGYPFFHAPQPTRPYWHGISPEGPQIAKVTVGFWRA